MRLFLLLAALLAVSLSLSVAQVPVWTMETLMHNGEPLLLPVKKDGTPYRVHDELVRYHPDREDNVFYHIVHVLDDGTVLVKEEEQERSFGLENFWVDV